MRTKTIHDVDISILCDDDTYRYIASFYDSEYIKTIIDRIISKAIYYLSTQILLSAKIWRILIR